VAGPVVGSDQIATYLSKNEYFIHFLPLSQQPKQRRLELEIELGWGRKPKLCLALFSAATAMSFRAHPRF